MSRSTPRPPALIVGVLAATAFVASLTQTLVIPILPTIPEQVGITAAQASWLVTITVVVGAVSNPLLGRLGDQLGRRRILLVAVGAFVIGSIIPALSDNYALLLIGRGVQGISTAAIPLGIGIISAAVPKERRATGIATISATLGIGGALGLPLAGVISTAWGFHGLFWFATVAGVIAFVVAFATIPDVRFASTERGVDVAGAVLLAAGLSTLLLGISIGPGTGWGAPLTLGLLAVAVVAFAALVAVELRVRNPIVDVRLAVARTPLLTNLAGFFTGFAFFTGTLGIITIAQLPLGIGFGLAIFAAGLALLPGGLLMAAVSPISGRLVGRIGGGAVLAAGSAVILLGFALQFTLHTQLWQLIVAASVLYAGVGLSYAAMPSVILAATPPESAGAVTGLNALARVLGTALSSTIFGVLSAGGLTASALSLYLLLGTVAIVLSFVPLALLPRRSRA